jgi:hypothetical protein
MFFSIKKSVFGHLSIVLFGLLLGCAKTETPAPAVAAPIVAKWELVDVKGTFVANYSGTSSSVINQKGTGNENFTFLSNNSFQSIGGIKIGPVSINPGIGTYKLANDELRVQAKDDLGKENVYYFKTNIVGTTMALQLTRDLYFKGLKESPGYAAGVQEAVVKELDVTLGFKK